MIIPLHTLVIFFNANKENLAIFHSCDILDFKDIKYHLFGDTNRTDINQIVIDELVRRTKMKLLLGERVVVTGIFLSHNKRNELIDFCKEYNIGLMYLFGDASYQNDKITLEQKELTYGDGYATSYQLSRGIPTIINKPPKTNLVNWIRNLGFNGISVIPDVHSQYNVLYNAMEWSSARNLFSIYLGDIIDYGPNPVESINLVYTQIMRGRAILCIGNHEKKMSQWINSAEADRNKIKLSPGNKISVDIYDSLSERDQKIWKLRFNTIYSHSKNHYVIGKNIFTHAAASYDMINITNNRLYGKLEGLALHGEWTLEASNSVTSYSWIDTIPQGYQVFVGHEKRGDHPIVVTSKNNAKIYFMDTGCGKGGYLTTAHLKFKDNDLSIESYTYH